VILKYNFFVPSLGPIYLDLLRCAGPLMHVFCLYAIHSYYPYIALYFPLYCPLYCLLYCPLYCPIYNIICWLYTTHILLIYCPIYNIICWLYTTPIPLVYCPYVIPYIFHKLPHIWPFPLLNSKKPLHALVGCWPALEECYVPCSGLCCWSKRRGGVESSFPVDTVLWSA
jgi:hypothetical protein